MRLFVSLQKLFREIDADAAAIGVSQDAIVASLLL
jgi:hypothetical protein